MKILTGLFMAAKRRLMTRDGEGDAFKRKLDELVARKDELKPDAIGEQPPEVAKEAANAVAKLYDELCNAALADVPDAAASDTGADGSSSPEAAQAPQEPSGAGKPEDADLAKGVDAAGKATGSELTTATKIATTDSDLSPETLEAIYQYCKKRAAPDAANGATDADGTGQAPNAGSDGTAGGDDKKAEEKGSAVSDHAPHIPVNLTGGSAHGGLAGLYNMAKGGK